MILIFVRIILSWFPASEGLFMTVQRFTFAATEWAMGPLRRVIPPVRLGAAALDLSPLIVLIGVVRAADLPALQRRPRAAASRHARRRIRERLAPTGLPCAHGADPGTVREDRVHRAS